MTSNPPRSSKPDAPAPVPSATGRAALLAWADAQAATLAANRAGVAAGSVEAVHRSRVAVRRLRVLFTTFAGLLAQDPGLRRDLRDLGLALGEVRDADVWAEHVAAVLAELGADADPDSRDAVLAAAASRRAAAGVALARVWDGAWADGVRERLAAWRADPGLHPDADLPAALALSVPLATAVTRAARAAARAGARPEEPDAWHDARKAAKAVRYGYELAGAVGAYRGRAPAWEAVTEALGELQDATVSQALLRDLAPSAEGTWGLLLQAEADRSAGALRAGAEALTAALEQEARTPPAGA